MSHLTSLGIALALLLAAAPARAQFGLGGLLGGNALNQAGTRAAPVQPGAAHILDPVSLGAPPVDPAALETPTRFDVALVLLEPKGAKGDRALAEAEAYWTRRTFRVAPRALVERRIAELGLLAPDALAATDYPQLGRRIGARFLVLLSVGSDGARRQIFSGAAGRVLAAGALLAVRASVRNATPAEVGGAVAVFAIATLAAGITTAATCDLSSQIFDCVAGRTIWVRTASTTKRKVLWGLFADKAALATQARVAAVERLFADVTARLPHRAR